MKFINIVVEGSSEEAFVNDVLVKHFAQVQKYVSTRKIRTGWDALNSKPAKGGLLKYSKLRDDIVRWVQSDRGKPNTFYSSFVDLYAFPKDDKSPYTAEIQHINDAYKKIRLLEDRIYQDIGVVNFIPYIQLHEFETFLLADIDKIGIMYPDSQTQIARLKREIVDMNPEEINESPQKAPSKRIIKFFPDYEAQKAQVGPLVAADIGLTTLREKCPHFNEWLNKLESL
ncbi:MAG: DUF4276 family protein [Spirosomaceae bacterium]|jgi:hypothetical protein|nr:DUF4276 family protein [Spirosomataceae bacterium]